MQIIPLLPVPSQTLSVILNGQQVGINVYALNSPGDILSDAFGTADTTLITADTTLITADATSGYPSTTLQGYAPLYVDVSLNGAAIVTARVASNIIPILLTSAYLGFEGELVFVDTQNVGLQNGTNPVYEGLGSRYQLVYLAPGDLA